MSSYQKFTLATFKGKLKNGAYENLTGANRAIGKTQGLSDDERDKARRMAAKHFGSDTPTPAPAAPAKKAAKKAAKKVAKKATKEPAAKVGKPAGVKKVAKKAKKKAKRTAAKPPAVVESQDLEPEPVASPKELAVVPRKAPTATATSTQLELQRAKVLEQMGSVITTVGQALKAMEGARNLFPKADLESGVTSASDSLSRAVRVIDREVISPRLTEDESPDSGKAAPKSGKRTKTSTAVAEEELEAEEAELSEEQLQALQENKQLASNKLRPRATLPVD